MKVGFTGSQNGMSTAQLHTLRDWTIDAIDEIEEWHHGCCVGADTQSFLQTYEIFRELLTDDELREMFHFHPPTNTDKASDLRQFLGTWHDPRPYLVRNREIVDDTDVLIAAPGRDEEAIRSGTWSTIRYARALERDVRQLRRKGGWIVG